jgi:hypothetical protein
MMISCLFSIAHLQFKIDTGHLVVVLILNIYSASVATLGTN